MDGCAIGVEYVVPEYAVPAQVKRNAAKVSKAKAIVSKEKEKQSLMVAKASSIFGSMPDIYLDLCLIYA